MEIENIEKKKLLDSHNEYIRKAKEYIHAILYAVESSERCGKRPIIVMSMDVFDILVAFTQNTIKSTSLDKITCCGRDVEIAYGKNILFIAYDLQKIWMGE